MSKYEGMSLNQLFVLWVDNWKVMLTGMKEIAGDDPMPEPREMAQLLIEMPEEVWINSMENEHSREYMKKQMDVQKLMAEIQLENVAILDAALKRGS